MRVIDAGAKTSALLTWPMPFQAAQLHFLLHVRWLTSFQYFLNYYAQSWSVTPLVSCQKGGGTACIACLHECTAEVCVARAIEHREPKKRRLQHAFQPPPQGRLLSACAWHSVPTGQRCRAQLPLPCRKFCWPLPGRCIWPLHLHTSSNTHNKEGTQQERHRRQSAVGQRQPETQRHMSQTLLMHVSGRRQVSI